MNVSDGTTFVYFTAMKMIKALKVQLEFISIYSQAKFFNTTKIKLS